MSICGTQTKEDCSRFQETSVLQSYILLEFYGVYVCDDTLLSKAQAIHHAVVGAIRELQMTHDGHASRLDSPEEPECIPSLAANNSATLQQRWREFIAEEERKRCIYAVYLLDSQLSIACNLRPQLSALEIKYQLPSADDLWAAPTAESWDKLQKEHFRSFNEHDDRFGTDEVTPSQGSLHGSTQDLLFNRPADPHPPALRLLWYSPFAALVLVTQLQMTARELTHASCLLLRPKLSRNAAMSDDNASHQQQRPLSILTEAQHGQISQALRNIAELAPQPQHHRHPAAASSSSSSTSALSTSATTEGNHPLWHSFWLTWRYTSLTLSHSDALLVSGVVETNLPAAIATAGHLARPRRKRYRDRYEDRDVFRILVDLERALVGIGRGPGCGGTNGSAVAGVPELENPFLTLLAFKISLIGWRIVRLTAMTAMADEGVAAYDGLGGGGGGRCDPSRFVLRSIMAAIGEDTGMSGDADGGRMMDAEVRYLRWVQEALQKRTVWPVGKWEAAIVQEAAAEAAEYAAMARECGGGGL
ncbi:hypothetical protein DIS24_g6710 [Lasiodiplodia hormozganensis]|uniref:Xylanolytic transcriptional activator regulatory domain-containing protein n=1 Tax=Lasiodiplodia hormozganensis TaxID=869390 RepID=A0AA40CVC1_9PEZI|nr:hypothetical protein DIS24_g6710 [Lasiodiplodia hormozganensis]